MNYQCRRQEKKTQKKETNRSSRYNCVTLCRDNRKKKKLSSNRIFDVAFQFLDLYIAKQADRPGITISSFFEKSKNILYKHHEVAFNKFTLNRFNIDSVTLNSELQVTNYYISLLIFKLSYKSKEVIQSLRDMLYANYLSVFLEVLRIIQRRKHIKSKNSKLFFALISKIYIYVLHCSPYLIKKKEVSTQSELNYFRNLSVSVTSNTMLLINSNFKLTELIEIENDFKHMN
ncbi:LOW QUALITY PROTEIN: hypothetical protein V1477_011455 [Vespula maculifrons]|uniref:Uncharacterized protein n=1 Tax=Vespula maculifrons TaxID=7453 RepID=A0ABD2BZ95_VESMC